jgi:uncharacterized protein (DUF302 family)
MADTPLKADAPLKLVPMEEDDDDSVVGRVKRIDELVDELIAANEDLKEEMEKIRLALGMDRYDFDRFRQDGFVLHHQITVSKDFDRVIEKLEKALGYGDL